MKTRYIKYMLLPLVLPVFLILISGCGLFDGSSGGLEPVGEAIVPYQDEEFTVKPLHEYMITINMNSGTVLEGYLTIRGGNDDIRFYIKDSYGNKVLDKNRVNGRYDFSYTYQSSGYHTMYFDNSFSLITSKQVFLHYRVR